MEGIVVMVLLVLVIFGTFIIPIMVAFSVIKEFASKMMDKWAVRRYNKIY